MATGSRLNYQRQLIYYENLSRGGIKKMTPLMFASCLGYLEIVKELLKHEPVKKSINRYLLGQTALSLASKHRLVAQHLIKHGAQPRSLLKAPPLIKATGKKKRNAERRKKTKANLTFLSPKQRRARNLAQRTQRDTNNTGIGGEHKQVDDDLIDAKANKTYG